MKKYFIFFLLLIESVIANACPNCSKQQPRILKEFTHGGGPENNLDYLIVSVALVIVVVTLFFSVKWLIWPGEKGERHIKRIVLNYE